MVENILLAACWLELRRKNIVQTQRLQLGFRYITHDESLHNFKHKSSSSNVTQFMWINGDSSILVIKMQITEVQ